ncbi:MAG: hypothetical protein J5490_01255 [Bacteroidales bacterium]|nr:hypothetical protein [Bacteroidales bacterium]
MNRLALFLIILFLPACKYTQEANPATIELYRTQKKYASPYSAILFYSSVENNKKLDDHARGELFLDLAELYGEILNYRKEKEYIEKGMDLLDGKDTLLYNESLLRLAYAYQKLEDWDKAEALYQEGFTKGQPDMETLSRYHSTYARMKLEQPKPDPFAAYLLLRRKKESELTLDDRAMKAYVYLLLSREDLCDRILASFSQLSIAERHETAYWEFKIYKQRGDQASAGKVLLDLFEDQEDILKVISINSSPTILAENYREEADLEKEKVRVQRLSFVLSGIITVLLLSMIIVLLERKRRKALATEQSILRLYEESKEVNNSLRKDFVALYEQQFAQLGELCEAYIHTDKVGALYHRMRFLLGDLQADDQLFSKLEQTIDAGCDGIVSHLRNEIEGVTEQDIRFFCFNLLGLSNDSIAVLTGVETSTVYSRRSRLKKRILSSDTPYKEILLQSIH